MSKPQFDPSKFSTTLGTLYYDGKKATAYRIKQYNRYISGGGQARATSISRQYGKYFSAGTRFSTAKGGHLDSWAKPLTLRGGSNPNFNWSRAKFRGSDSQMMRDSSSTRWGANINSNASATILVGTKQWIRQLQISLHALYVSAGHFRIVVGQRAIKVFQNSFKYQQFYSSRTQRWKPLASYTLKKRAHRIASYTLKKRAHRGTGHRILKEYDDLYNSIKIDENARPMTTRVYTDIVPANASKHKKHSICYAGYHNEGKGTYGRGWNGHKPKPYIRRQFMGHSSHLNPFKDAFLRKMMKIYLFDSVFLVKKA